MQKVLSVLSTPGLLQPLTPPACWAVALAGLALKTKGAQASVSSGARHSGGSFTCKLPFTPFTHLLFY